MPGGFEAFTVLIGEIARCIYRIKTEETEGLKLRASHVTCLYYLYRRGELPAAELCGVSGEDRANMSRTAAELEKRGYVCAAVSAGRHGAPLTLTEKGREAGRTIAEKADRVIERANAGLDVGDRAAMYRALGVICSNLRAMAAEYDLRRGEGAGA